MIHYFYGTLQLGIGQTLCSFEHVSCLVKLSPVFDVTSYGEIKIVIIPSFTTLRTDVSCGVVTGFLQ